MKLSYDITFEGLTEHKSSKGEIEASNLRTCVGRAIAAAKAEHKGARWNSVIVVVQKLGKDAEQEVEDTFSELTVAVA